MSVRFTDKGWTKWLGLYVRQGAHVHLFASGDSPETLTDVVDPHYAPIALVGAQWEIKAWGPVIIASYPEVGWRFAAPQTPLGHYVTDDAGDLVWWEPFLRADDEREPPKLHIQQLAMTIEIDTKG